jgi:CRP/FNR family transcriptional regulator
LTTSIVTPLSNETYKEIRHVKMAETNPIKNCTENISKDKLLADLKESELNLLTNNIHHVEYNKGDTIVKQGQFITHAIYINYGYVKLEIEYFGRLYITDVVPGLSFVRLPVLLSENRHVFSVVALDKCRICFIDISILRSIIERNGKCCRAILNDSCKLYCQNQEKYFRYIKNNIHGRVANTLLMLHKDVFKSKKFDILLSRNELSQMTGISRENVIKVLSEMNNEGVIKVDGKLIEIKKLDYLEKVADKG